MKDPLPDVLPGKYHCIPIAFRYSRAHETTIYSERSPYILKKLVLSGVTSDAGLALMAPFRPRCASVLFLHRFAIPDLGVEGHDPSILHKHLEYLRARRYVLMSVADLLDHIEQKVPLEKNAVVFTVDDGYADFATVAAPVFAAFDCPVTVFLITDFVAGRLWNWFDRVAWAFKESVCRELRFEIGEETMTLQWKNAAERDRASEHVVERLKQIDDLVKGERIRALADALEVVLPQGVPVRDRAMSWDQVRRCARDGVTFGPHTVTHPILSRVDSARSYSEISQSWRAIADETGASVPVFCYPNGTPADFSAREEESVRRAGMRAALSTVEASLVSSPSGIKCEDQFAIPRFSYPERKPRFVQIASGLQAMRDRGRRVSS